MMFKFNQSNYANQIPETWFATPAGEYTDMLERNILNNLLAEKLGYYAIQMGTPQRNLLATSPISHKFVLGKSANCVSKMDYDYLAIQSSSVDLVLISHGLEFAEHPEIMIREAFRILRPEGYLIVCGFNPTSTFGLNKKFHLADNYPFAGNFIFAHRLKDWFKVLGLTIDTGYYLAYSPPWLTMESNWLRDKIEKLGNRWLPLLGGVYIYSAIKRIPSVRMIKSRWKQKVKESIAVSVAERRSNQ